MPTLTFSQWELYHLVIKTGPYLSQSFRPTIPSVIWSLDYSFCPQSSAAKLIWNKKIKTLFPITPSPEINRQPGSQLIWHSSAHLGDPRVTDRISLPLFCTAFQKSLPSQLLWIKWPCSSWWTGTNCRGKRRMKTTLNRRKKALLVIVIKTSIKNQVALNSPKKDINNNKWKPEKMYYLMSLWIKELFSPSIKY